MEKFKNAVFKQREEINHRMAEMFVLLKELKASKTPKKVLMREEARHPITKNVNSISLIRIEEEENNGQIDKSIMEPGKPDKEPLKGVDMKNEVERKADDEPDKSARKSVTKNEEDEPAGVSSSHVFNDSLSATQVGKMKRKTYNLLPKGLVKEDIGGNFEIPCNIGGLKHTNALVDQGSDVNIIPLSIYNKLTDERPVETDIKLSLASHSYIYPLAIAEDVLVDVANYVYPVDFMILDIREDEKGP
ncbi:MAK10-like protein [Tanacetum coccineum]